jgi:hypothetical protein
MLTILVRVKILTDALASVAWVWIRAWFWLSTILTIYKWMMSSEADIWNKSVNK